MAATKKTSPSANSAFIDRCLGTLTEEQKQKRALGMLFRGPVLAVIDDARAFLAYDGTSAILDLETGQSSELPFKPGREWTYLRRCAVSADGKSAIVAEEKGWVTVIRDLADAKKSRVRVRPHKEFAVASVGVSGDAFFVHLPNTSEKSKTNACVQVWSCSTQRVVKTLPTPTSCAAAISRQGAIALVGLDDRFDPKGEVELWSAPYEKPRLVKLAPPKKGFTRVLQFSHDGSVLACGLSPTGADRCFEEVVLVDVATAKVLGRVATKPGRGITVETELRRKMTPATWIHPLSASEFVIIDMSRGVGEIEELAFERWSLTSKSPLAREIITLDAEKKQLGMAMQIAFGPDFVVLNRERVVTIR